MSLDPLLEEAGLSAEEVLEWAKKRADALLEQAQDDPELATLAEGLESSGADDGAAQARIAALEAGDPAPSTVDTERVAVLEGASRDSAEDGADSADLEELDLEDVEELDDDMLELIEDDDDDPDQGEGAELAKALVAEVSTGEPAVRTGKTQRNAVVVAAIANDGPPPPPPGKAAAGPDVDDLAGAPVVTGDTNIQTPVAAVIPGGDDDLPDELRDELGEEDDDDDLEIDLDDD